MAKNKLPKKFMGMRIPKAMRRIGSDALANPLGRELIAEVLVHAAAGLLRSQSKPNSATRQFLEHPVQSGADAAATAGTAAENTASTVVRAIDGLLGYLHTAREERSLKCDAKASKRKGKKRKNTVETRTTH